MPVHSDWIADGVVVDGTHVDEQSVGRLVLVLVLVLVVLLESVRLVVRWDDSGVASVVFLENS